MYDCYGWFDDFDNYCWSRCPDGYKCFYLTYGYYWDKDDYYYDDYYWY